MKILGSDFDGTFTVGGVDAGKLEALRKWRLAGNKFGIISGRSKDFGGTLDDADVIKLRGCSRNSYYKYKKELKFS